MSLIGVDVGGTRIKTGVVQRNLEVCWRDERATPDTAQGIVQAVYDMVQLAWRKAPGARVGVSFAGTWDGEGCVTANQLGLKRAPVKRMLQDAFGVALPLENDAVCALLAEHRYGSLQGCETAILLTLGTGIGGGVLVQGQPLRGHRGLHGELGHMITHLNGLDSVYTSYARTPAQMAMHRT